MYVLIWRYRVPDDAEGRFVAHYGPDGSWARLFRRGAGYLGTELLRGERDDAGIRDFATIDRWTSAEQHARFLEHFAAAYRSLDEECEALTDAETFVGAYETSPGTGEGIRETLGSPPPW